VQPEETDMNTRIPRLNRPACLALALVAGLTAQAASAAEASTLRVDMSAEARAPVPDMDITRQVAAVLAADPALVGTRIDVSTYRGVVMLSGQLDSVPMIYRAVALTRRVDGVRAVDDRELVKG
jgi:osmotically-inducible protein OsmY